MNWWRELVSARRLPFVFAGLAVGLTTFGIGLAAKRSADESLRLAVADIESDCNDQLSLLLHADAVVFEESLARTNRLSESDLNRLLDFLCIDEVTLVDQSGRIVATTAPGATVGNSFFTDECRQRPYRRLLTGRQKTVQQRFRPSTTQSDRLVKYFAMALPKGGFLQVGYVWETFEREFPRYFLPIFESRQIGKSGYCVAIGPDGRIEVEAPGHPESLGKLATEIGLAAADFERPPGQIFRARLFGTLCRCLFYEENIANRRVLAAVPLSEGQGPALLLAIGVASVILAGFLLFRFILRKFRLQQARIDALRATEEEHRAADLALARSIQRAELRTDGTVGAGYRLATLMNAAREVGGDFYDYYELPDGRLVITIADVSGKGVPAAFFMMKARMTLKACVTSIASLTDAVAEANRQLAANNPAEMFVTAWVGIFDRQAGTVDFVSAGHNEPVKVEKLNVEELKVEGLKRGKGEWVRAPRCAALGVFESAKYRGARVPLAPGDRLFLYTDGVTEAMNRAGELFGNGRLLETLSGGAASAESLIPRVTRTVEAFVAGAEQSDDITMLELIAMQM